MLTADEIKELSPKPIRVKCVIDQITGFNMIPRFGVVFVYKDREFSSFTFIDRTEYIRRGKEYLKEKVKDLIAVVINSYEIGGSDYEEK